MKFKRRTFPEIFYDFENRYGRIIAICLCNAGINSFDAAESYLFSEDLADSSLLPGISKVNKIIKSSIKAKNYICIFGDYDADGVTSSAIMKITLDTLGADSYVRLPDRNEGYGISMTAIHECIAKNVKLIITVDNGIRAIEEIKAAKEHGIKVIILDHHVPGDTVPIADAIIDLHWKKRSYPFIHLTGSGLSFKVAMYLLKDTSFDSMSLCDLAAIGTIADVETLLGENRAIVKNAIRQMRNPKYNRYGVKALAANLEFITAEDIAFQIGPCINACGRLEARGAEIPLELLLSNNENDAENRAKYIIEINEKRKLLQKECYADVQLQARKMIQNGDTVLVVVSDKAPTGIVGLLAGALKEEFNRPAIVFGKKDVVYTGSARSIPEYNILEAISECSEHLLKFGGHALAAGMSISPEKIDDFREELNQRSALSAKDLELTVSYCGDLTEKETEDISTYEALDMCEPFGQGNPKPVFKVNVTTKPDKNGLFTALGKDGQHLKLKTEKDLSIVGFNLAEKYKKSGSPRKLIAYGTFGRNHFGGNEYKQLRLIAFDAVAEHKTDLMAQLSEMLKF